jgi:5-methylcytosine-specific restriction endonuclease McrA
MLPEDFFLPQATDQEIAREKAKARELRKSQWWKRKRSSGVCHYCGRQFPPRELTMDHVVPLIRGGKTAKSNVVPCCAECNARKKYLLPVEWEEYLRTLNDVG